MAEPSAITPDPSSALYHESRVPSIYGSSIPFVITATFIVGLRMYARRNTAAGFWWDDWTIIGALILCWSLDALYWAGVHHADAGRHAATAGGPAGPEQLEIFFKLLMAIQVVYFSCAAAIKTSLILLYYRIFGVERWFRRVLGAAWIIVLLYFVINVLVAIFECMPVTFYWDKTIAGKCLDQSAFFRWNGVANLLIDFMILCLPMPLVWRLNLETKQKVSLSAIFLLGLFACACSIIRVVTFNQLRINDITYTNVSSGIWTTLEQTIGIICACLPTLRPLVGRFFDTMRSTGHSGSFSMKNIAGTSKASKKSAFSNISRKSRNRGDDEEAGSGAFSKLDEERLVDSSHGTVTTHATRIPSGDVAVVPERILKNQTIEQHRDMRPG